MFDFLLAWKNRRSARPNGDGETSSNTLRYALTDEAEDIKPRCLISFLGELPPRIGEIVDTVAVACRDKGEFPVAVLSEIRPEVIANSSVVIEFMPTRRHLPTLSDRSYDRYVRRRWSLINAKWGFASTVELALTFDEFLAAQLTPAAGETGAMPWQGNRLAARSP